MATTSLSLGPHWEAYIKAQVESGRYASASEVMREALRLQEARGAKLERLRAHLKEGYDQAKRGEFVEFGDEAIDEIIERAKARQAEKTSFPDDDTP
jgi:antitoxin ParD1/3/4